MDRRQVIITCVLLTVTSDLSAAQQVSAGCLTCPPGYYVKQSCRREADGRLRGVQCKRCTKCSAAVGQVTQVKCSMFADSLCRDENTSVSTVTATSGAAVSAPEDWMILAVIVISVFMILLLSLLLLILCCRNHCSHLRDKPLLPHNTPLPHHNKPHPYHNKPLLVSKLLPCGGPGVVKV